MSTEILYLFGNLFVILCACFTCYQLGQIKEMDRQAEIRNRESTEELIRIYRARRA